jgi:hypothetical protein
VDRRSDREEFGAAVEGSQLVGDTGDPNPAALVRLGHHPAIGLEATFVNHIGDLPDFAAQESSADRAERPEEAHREDRVPDHQLARRETFEIEAIHLVPREAGHERWHARG